MSVQETRSGSSPDMQAILGGQQACLKNAFHLASVPYRAAIWERLRRKQTSLGMRPRTPVVLDGADEMDSCSADCIKGYSSEHFTGKLGQEFAE
ncbi:hypothetical protein AcV7_002937 [Taiwanofungus camphoratus]|nr:hypothetical protein AcV7_002937 [Antrodia cinnamomea]